MACSGRFSLCSSSWVVSLFQWLRLWFLRVPKFIQVSWLFHTFPKTSKSQNRKQFLFAPSWIPWCVADARPGNISNVFNPPSCTHSWVTKAWLFCCYPVLWSPPFYSHILLCASITSCLVSAKARDLWTSLPVSSLCSPTSNYLSRVELVVCLLKDYAD